MTGLADIESALLQRLSMLRLGTAAAFLSIEGLASTVKSRVLSHLRARRKPAAAISYDGQKASSSGRPVLFSLFIACESLRGGDEARTGGTGVVGMHGLLDLLRANLDGTTLLCGCGLSLINEALVSDDDRLIVFRQTYEVVETS